MHSFTKKTRNNFIITCLLITSPVPNEQQKLYQTPAKTDVDVYNNFSLHDLPS